MILGFDTSGAHCAAALVSTDGSVMAEVSEAGARGQAERLFPLLAEVLRGAGAGWGDLAAIGVGTGPGNFTGLRIAVAAARGLALSTGLPAFGVDGFAARAAGCQGPLLVCIAAPRGQVHARRIDGAGAHRVETMSPAAALTQARAHGLTPVGEAVGHAPPLPLATGIAQTAARRLAAGDTPPRPAPFYVRPPDATPALR